MKVTAEWKSGMRFDGVTPARVGVVMDALPEHGGGGAGPAPLEALLMALAGCTGMDVIAILKKMRAPVDRFSIEVSAKRAEEHPRVFTAIHLRYIAAGARLRPGLVEKAVTLSQERYCSVSGMLRKAATITYEIVVKDLDAASGSEIRVPPGELVNAG